MDWCYVKQITTGNMQLTIAKSAESPYQASSWSVCSSVKDPEKAYSHLILKYHNSRWQESFTSILSASVVMCAMQSLVIKSLLLYLRGPCSIGKSTLSLDLRFVLAEVKLYSHQLKHPDFLETCLDTGGIGNGETKLHWADVLFHPEDCEWKIRLGGSLYIFEFYFLFLSVGDATASSRIYWRPQVIAPHMLFTWSRCLPPPTAGVDWKWLLSPKEGGWIRSEIGGCAYKYSSMFHKWPFFKSLPRRTLLLLFQSEWSTKKSPRAIWRQDSRG